MPQSFLPLLSLDFWGSQNGSFSLVPSNCCVLHSRPGSEPSRPGRRHHFEHHPGSCAGSSAADHVRAHGLQEADEETYVQEPIHCLPAREGGGGSRGLKGRDPPCRVSPGHLCSPASLPLHCLLAISCLKSQEMECPSRLSPGPEGRSHGLRPWKTGALGHPHLPPSLRV